MTTHGGMAVAAAAAAAASTPMAPVPPHRIGREGRLYLSLRRDDASDSRTILAGCRAEPPLSVQRALYCEQGLPGMAYVYVSSTSGGILQGDRHVIRLDLGAGATSHITTQGATRIYGTDCPPAPGGAAGTPTSAAAPTVTSPPASSSSTTTAAAPPEAARQTLHASLGERAYLEFIPDQTIPYAGSAFVQDVTLSVHDTATAIYAEIISPGRAGMGESFAYRLYDTKITVTNHDGTFRLADAARITPQDSRVGSLGMMGKYDTVASMYVITEQRHVGPLQQEIDSMILQDDAVAGGAAVTHNDSGVLVRLLGSGSEPVKSAMYGAARLVRNAVLGAPFTQVRKS